MDNDFIALPFNDHNLYGLTDSYQIYQYMLVSCGLFIANCTQQYFCTWFYSLSKKGLSFKVSIDKFIIWIKSIF